MKRSRLISVFVIASFLNYSGGVTQEQNIKQTVDYINKAIEKDPYYGGKDNDIEFDVDDKGKLTAQYYWGDYKAFKHMMHLKNLDKSKVKRDTSKIYGRDIIELHCKETDHCIKKKVNHKQKTREKGEYSFSVTDKNEAGRRVQNAFIHLIQKAKARYQGSEEKKKDPYDY
ncbi:MAG: hypothetical protein ABEH38_01775 [Flavobacteriales bacterium]